MSEDKLRFFYKLLFPDGTLIEFPIDMDMPACAYSPTFASPPHNWTKLEHHQCSNCPLNANDSPDCPVAVNLTPLLTLCSSIKSFQSVQLEVTTHERTISGETTMQKALSSMLGLIMATSPCPHLEYLKPMARFHLPLASEEETIYRTTSMYLLGQYFRKKEGLAASSDFEELQLVYKNLQIINRALAKRLQSAVTEDATINAVVILDLLSRAVTWSIDEGLEEVKPLFNGYGVKT